MRYTTSPKRLDAWLSRRERDRLTWSELSRVSGIAAWKLRYRAGRDSARPKARRRPGRRRLLPVAVVDRSPRAGLEVVTPAGLRVLIPPDFDAEHLGRVLQVLGRSC